MMVIRADKRRASRTATSHKVMVAVSNMLFFVAFLYIAAFAVNVSSTGRDVPDMPVSSLHGRDINVMQNPVFSRVGGDGQFFTLKAATANSGNTHEAGNTHEEIVDMRDISAHYHDGTVMELDNAVYDIKGDRMKGHGHVKITTGDGHILTADEVYMEGKDVVIFRHNVRLVVQGGVR